MLPRVSETICSASRNLAWLAAGWEINQSIARGFTEQRWRSRSALSLCMYARSLRACRNYQLRLPMQAYIPSRKWLSMSAHVHAHPWTPPICPNYQLGFFFYFKKKQNLEFEFRSS